MYRIVLILASMFIASTVSAQTTVWRYDPSTDKWVFIGDKCKEHALDIKPQTTTSNGTGLTLNTDVAYDAALAPGLGLQQPLEKKKTLTHYCNRDRKDNNTSSPSIQLKSNMLYDTMLAPSGGLELTLGKKWTVGTDGFIAWIRNRETNLWYQYYGFDVYGRYWLNGTQTNCMTGFHVGLYAGTLTYDVYPNHKGYQSKKMFTTFRVGTEFGYSWNLSPRNDHWRMDIYGSLGLFHTRQDVYKPYGKGRYIREERRWRNYPDFTRCGITIGYVYGRD